MKIQIITYLVAAISLALIGCKGEVSTGDSSPLSFLDTEFKGAWKDSEESIKAKMGFDPEDISTEVMEGVEEMFSVEYKVIDVAKNASAERMEGILRSLGKERWEIFNIIESEKELRFFLKRKPINYLYLSKAQELFPSLPSFLSPE